MDYTDGSDKTNYLQNGYNGYSGYNKCYKFLKDVKDSITYVEIFTLIIYVGLTITLFSSIGLEKNDIYYKKLNKNYLGAVYCEGKVDPDDDLDQILEKIRISARHDVSSVYWRRSITFSILVSFVLLIAVLQRFPTGLEWIIAVLILYLTIYFFLIYYQEAISKPAVEQVTEATHILKSRYNDFYSYTY